MKAASLFLLTILAMSFTPNKSVSKNGMTVQWEFVAEHKIQFTLQTPSTGWAAIGLNTENGLVGSNLIMASTSDRENLISDRFVLGLGNHQSVEDLGASSKVKLLSAREEKTGTTIVFEMETATQDDYHFDLCKGKKIYLTIAYSHEDDFMHHSAMRTLIEIIL